MNTLASVYLSHTTTSLVLWPSGSKNSNLSHFMVSLLVYPVLFTTVSLLLFIIIMKFVCRVNIEREKETDRGTDRRSTKQHPSPKLSYTCTFNMVEYWYASYRVIGYLIRLSPGPWFLWQCSWQVWIYGIVIMQICRRMHCIPSVCSVPAVDPGMKSSRKSKI